MNWNVFKHAEFGTFDELLGYGLFPRSARAESLCYRGKNSIIEKLYTFEQIYKLKYIFPPSEVTLT